MDDTYIGTKVVRAQPMTREAYSTLRGWTVPADENGADQGYLVEYQDGGKPNHPDYAGYISWSPKDVFDNAYRAMCNGLSMGDAINAMRAGYKVRREGWNGKGMFIYHVPAASYPARNNPSGTMLGVFENDMVPYQEYIAMKTAQNNVVPWLASQSDLLAKDWAIVE